MRWRATRLLPSKPLADDMDAVMGFAARPRAAVSGMPVRFVDDVKGARGEAFGEAGFDAFLHTHGGYPWVSRFWLALGERVVKMAPLAARGGVAS